MGKRISVATRSELVAAIKDRYRAKWSEKSQIMNEFVAVTGYHRKHAIRLLRGRPVAPQTVRRVGRRVYGAEIHDARIVLWEISDPVCSKRLQPLIPVLARALERFSTRACGTGGAFC